MFGVFAARLARVSLANRAKCLHVARNSNQRERATYVYVTHRIDANYRCIRDVVADDYVPVVADAARGVKRAGVFCERVHARALARGERG